MIRRFRCIVCNNILEGKPPNLIVCRNCKAFYIFKYAKNHRDKLRKGHYVFAGFLDNKL